MQALAWKLLTDPETKEVYWFNYAVKTTSPTVPAELPLEMVEKLEEGAGIFWYNSVTDEASWEDPSLSTWRRVTNELGNIFWYHPHVRTHRAGSRVSDRMLIGCKSMSFVRPTCMYVCRR